MILRRALAPIATTAVLATSTEALAAPPAADPWLGPDKAAHFGVSAIVAGAGYGLSALGTDDLRIRIAFGAGAGVLVGGAKELVDLAGHGDPSWKDFVWDIAGTVVGVGIAISLDLAIGALRSPAAAR